MFYGLGVAEKKFFSAIFFCALSEENRFLICVYEVYVLFLCINLKFISMRKHLFLIAFIVLGLQLSAQVRDSMSREAKIYTEEAGLVYDHVSECYIGKRAYKRKYGKHFFHDVKRLSKVVCDAPEYTQEQFLRAVALHQSSIDKNYETLQKLKRKNLKFKRAGATLFTTSLAADIISSVVISRKKEVDLSYNTKNGKPVSVTTRIFNKAKAYRITQWVCCTGMLRV